MARVTSKAGRNDSCPCGSGKKFKKCCEAKTARGHASTLVMALAAAMFIGGIAYALSTFGEGSSTPAPGRTWSAEHGHWH